jgi:class 3 adenylate cyclase
MPDSVWIQRQLVFLSRVGNLIRLSGGTIIKTIGDELMGTFDKETSISKIVDCYLTIHGTFENLRAYNKGRFKIKVKGAIDFGECYNGNVLGDIFDPIGTSVDRCARMMKHANSSSLLFSDNAFSEDELVKAKKSFTLSEFTESFKGLGATHFWGLNI